MMIILVVIVLIVLVFTRVMPFVMDDVLVLSDAFEVGLELALALTLWQRADLHVDISTSHFWLLIEKPHA